MINLSTTKQLRSFPELFDSAGDSDDVTFLEMHANAKLCYAQANWAVGNMKEGFDVFNQHMGSSGNRPELEKPLSKKNMDKLAEHTIVVRATDGFGDTFTFFKFLKQLKERGAKKIIAVVQRPLKQMLSRSTEMRR